MKNLSLFVSAVALLSASSAFAAIDCGILPTCASLGYDTAKANCPASKFLACPFDTNTGKCTHDAAVGDLKYSLKSANHDGWILCDGQSISKTTYSALYSVIGTNYGGSGDNFNVPDYRGFFLRAYGTASGTYPLSSYGGSAKYDIKTPQREELPNIKATWYGAYEDGATKGNSAYTGAIRLDENNKGATKWNMEAKGETAAGYMKYDFNAQNNYALGTLSGDKYINKTNSTTIYKDNGHVIPANYAAYVFIYAGK